MKVSINTFRAAEFQLQTFFAHIVQNLKNSYEHEIEEIVLVATFKLSVATCGDWRQGWTTLA